MSTEHFDPSRITIADIFRAKEERRRRLAKLPFEEKIKILERLKTIPARMMANEKLIFEAFLKVYPDFASEPIKEWNVVNDWHSKRSIPRPPQPFDERPDIIAVTNSGKRIGIELKSWVNREQIAAARKQERIQDNILSVIGKPQPSNETQNIGSVWLSPKHVRFDTRDAAGFRDQLLRQIAKADDEMTSRSLFEQMSTYDVDHFDEFPLIEKYLNMVRFRPVARSGGTIRWIRFPDASKFYSPNGMLKTLSTSLNTHKNDERYKDLKAKVHLDEVYLLVHYDFKAFAYNTPFDAPNFGFKQAAEFAKESLNGSSGYFDRVFLFHFLFGQEEAYRIL
jgi:hypothetical protein